MIRFVIPVSTKFPRGLCVLSDNIAFRNRIRLNSGGIIDNLKTGRKA
jgi:hypothetical protein